MSDRWPSARARAAPDPQPAEVEPVDSVPEWMQLPQPLGLTVVEGRVPDSLPGSQLPLPWIEVTASEALIRVSEGLAVHVRRGRDMTVHWDGHPGSDLTLGGDPSWVVHGLAVQIAALQRGSISLHASTVMVGAAVLAIAGRSGAGKSTTAMGLVRRGHQLLVDDVTLVEFRGSEVWTTPFARGVHLTRDAADALGLDFDSLSGLAGRSGKGSYLGEHPPQEANRLDAIVVLLPTDPDGSPGAPGWEGLLRPPPDAEGSEGVDIREVRGAARLGALMDQTIMDGVATAVLGHDEYFHQLARLADSLRVFIIRRPAGKWSLEHVMAAVESIRA